MTAHWAHLPYELLDVRGETAKVLHHASCELHGCKGSYTAVEGIPSYQQN